MKSKNFNLEIWDAIEKATAETLLRDPNPLVAFDADGTLWDTDLGESFFRYQIENLDLPQLRNLPTDPWTYYRNWKNSGDPRPAYLWLAQINQSFSLSQVHAWANACVKTLEPLPIFPAQKKLIDYFLSQKIKVYVVTASVKWAVEPGAKILGIPEDQVLGVATKVTDGFITDTQEGLITYRQGKADALLQKTLGKKPFFCCGNTTGDLNLLECSANLALAVSSAQEQDELYKSEQPLQVEALKRGWLRHQF